MKLKNNFIAGKTFDDRACIVCMLEAMDILKNYKLHCNVVFCASVQEESAGGGAKAGGYKMMPLYPSSIFSETTSISGLRSTKFSMSLR